MAAGVTPKQVYQSLINAGASTIQAIGIMANSINESGLDPEQIGDQGTSFGIVQEHGSQYAGLVTGAPATDLGDQTRQIALNGGFKAASGSTPAEAAGNFAANYERCVGCQPGGAQYNGRVANAAVVAGWVSSGNWPTSAGSATAQASSSSSGAAGSECALSLGGQHIGLLFGHGPTLPSACLIRKTEVRAVLGAMILVGGGLVALPGLVIMLVYAFRASGAAAVVVGAAEAVPGYGRVVRRASGAARTRAAPETAPKAARRPPVDQQARAAAGSQAQQRRAIRGQAPRQPAPKPKPKPPPAVHHE